MTRRRVPPPVTASSIINGAPHVIAWIAFLLCIVGVVILAAMGKPIPAALDAFAGLTGGAGSALSVARPDGD